MRTHAMKVAAEQRRALERRRLAKAVRALASRGGLTSYMNDTKWARVCFGFDEWPSRPRFRTCDLCPTDLVTAWSQDFRHDMLPFVSIRWMDVELAPDEIPDAVAMCKEFGAAVERTDSGVRVWGRVGPDDRPRFA